MNIVKNIPNSITSMNILCGALGVIFTLEGRLDIAFYLMLAGSVCDFCDGLAARALKAYSDMGKELDSLADMVSFGLLPSLMLYKTMSMSGVTGFWCYIPLAIAVFSGLRLAKFNIDDRQSENFIGLPTPACAMICGSYAYYVFNGNADGILEKWASNEWIIPVVSVVLALLLVSEIPMFSMKIKKGAKATKAIKTMRAVFFSISAIALAATIALGLNWSLIVLTAFTSYILINLVGALACHKA